MSFSFPPECVRKLFYVSVWRKHRCRLQCYYFLWFGNVLKRSLTSLEMRFVFKETPLPVDSKSEFLPPYPITAADGLGSLAIDTTQLNMSVTDPTAWATAMNNLGMVPVGLPGQQLVSGKLALGLEDACNHATGCGRQAPWPSLHAQVLSPVWD